ncbi:MAG: hypothetical protein ACRDB0_06335 [Paraclostridium sp.]
MGFIVRIIYVYMEQLAIQDIMKIINSVLVGASMYIISIYILKVREVNLIIDIAIQFKEKLLKLSKFKIKN